MSKVYKYKSFDEDVVTTSGQDYQLPEDYRYIRDRWWERLWSAMVYGFFSQVARFWLRWGLHARFVGRKKLLRAPRDKGFFVYGNHTQEFGDPMIALALGFRPVKRRIRALCAPSNLGVPGIGPLIPYLGGIPIAPGRDGLQETEKAVSWCCNNAQPVVIFPEAHVWPWYTGIRPFSSASFHYPVQENLPVFAMTVTYQKRRRGSRPRTTIYIDGPWIPDPALPEREQKKTLCETVRLAMEVRSESSTCTYAEYRKVE